LPKPGSIEPPAGVSAQTMEALITVDKEGWKKEIADVRENHYSKFGEHLPKVLYEQLDKMEKGLNS
ncbi:MAG: phosphoenolpyruvate carboxykinase domain-containing protein, partial [Treponema sp.]|nr:phosphoenolpyruvate carboxykinase domain-containing protein [Treponema sp.]